METCCAAHSGSDRQPSPHDVPPEGVTRLMSPAEFEGAVENTRGGRPAIVMCKSKSCKPCRAFNKTYYQYAKDYDGRCDFFEMYGDETKDTIKMMMKMKVKSTPNFRIYRDGEEVHEHSGVNQETFTSSLQSFV
eukprot:jgi/Tetstr1/466139/TSEL_010701.t1